MGFEVGQNVSVEELLLATILRSANDAAAALGEAVAGSEAEFARQMNARAQTLGLRNTRFANASGLPSTAAYTTARDMAHLALQMLAKQRHWLPLFSRRKATVAGKTLRGYNRWLSDFSGATGLKTGFTCRAGYHLAALSTRGGRETLTIVLGAPTQQIRFQSALRATNQALGRTPEPYPKLDPTVRPDSRPVPTVLRAEACAAPASGVGGRSPSRWSIVFEVFVGAPEARARARQFRRLYARGGRLYCSPLHDKNRLPGGLDGVDPEDGYIRMPACTRRWRFLYCATTHDRQDAVAASATFPKVAAEIGWLGRPFFANGGSTASTPVPVYCAKAPGHSGMGACEFEEESHVRTRFL